jgi:cytochrome c oxidase subunit 1
MANVATTTTKTYDEDVLIKEYGYDDHFHEHHHGDKYQSILSHTYIFSQDHKMIAKQFLITGMFWAFIGGADVIGFPSAVGFSGRKSGMVEAGSESGLTVNEADGSVHWHQDFTMLW